MKKKVLIIAISLLVVLPIAYYYVTKKEVNTSVNIAQHIPNNNGIVGVINYAGIKDEMLQNPLDLLRVKDQLGNNQFIGDLVLALVSGGIDENQKMVFSLAEKLDDGSFLLIQLTNAKKIEANLKEQLTKHKSNKIEVQKGAFGNYYVQQKIGIVVNKNFMLIAFTSEKKVKDLWTQVVEKKECYAVDNTPIKTILNSPDHVSVWAVKDGLKSKYLNGNNELFSHVNFLKGKLTVNTTIATTKTYFTKQPTNTFGCDTCALALSVNMKQINTLPELFGPAVNNPIDSIFDLLNIKFPKLVAQCNGQINCALIGEGVNKETIVTYAFDDDFNKIKKEKVVLTPTIDYLFSLGSDEKGIYKHFLQNGLIKKDKGKEIFTNPVGKCYVAVSNTNFLLASKEDFLLKNTIADTLNAGFIFKTNLDQLLPLLPKDSTYQNDFKTISCIGTQQDTLINFNLNITTKSANKNALFDVVNSCFQ